MSAPPAEIQVQVDDVEIYKSEDVSIKVVDSHIIVRCPLLKNSFRAPYENLPQKYKHDLLNWCYAISCLSFELNPGTYDSPSELLEKFSILPNENGGREYLFISFVAESFPLDHKYTLEDEEHLTEDVNVEIALFKGVLDYLVEKLKQRNRRIVSEGLSTHIAIQDHELIPVETCNCTIQWKKDTAREQKSKDLANIFTAEVRAGKNPTLYYVIHLFRTFFYFFKALDWVDLHVSDCTLLVYQTNLQLLDDKRKLVESAAQEKLETEAAQLKAIEARRKEHEEEKSANAEEEKAKTISSLKAIARGESGSLEFSSNRSSRTPMVVDSDQWFPGLDKGFPGLENLEPRLPEFAKPGSSCVNHKYNQVKIQSKLFENIDFRAANFNDCTFEDCIFIDCSFRTAQFKQCIFRGCTIRTCDFSGANLNRVYFSRCGIKRCNLDAAIKTDVSFINCQVQGTLINFRR